MALRSVGTDICRISRVSRLWKRFGERFEMKMLHPSERDSLAALTASGHDQQAHQVLASRWAAKEAVFKAVGGYRLLFPDIEILPVPSRAAPAPAIGGDEDVLPKLPRAPSRGPAVRFHGESEVAVRRVGVDRVELSVSHDEDLVFAVAAAVGRADAD